MREFEIGHVVTIGGIEQELYGTLRPDIASGRRLVATEASEISFVRVADSFSGASGFRPSRIN